MDENDYILDSGFMFGFFESGPWLAAKFSKNPAMAWIGGGTKSYEIGVTLRYHVLTLCSKIIIQVWRHICLSLSQSTGTFKVVENGVIERNQEYDEVIDWMSRIAKQVGYRR